MRVPALVLLFAAVGSAGPLRYRYERGETFVLEGTTEVEVITRRGAGVERLAFRRAGAQHVTVCAREGERRLFAIATEHAAATAVAWEVDGRDRRGSDPLTLAALLPARSRSVDFLELDDRGRGAPVPLDADLQGAVLSVLGEVEVLPEGEETSWRTSGAVGALTWSAVFSRSGATVTSVFTLTATPRAGARVLFDGARAAVTLADGRVATVEGWAAWTVATSEGTERREIRYRLAATPGPALAPEDVAAAAASAAQLASAAEAWRTGERDRALDLWTRAGGDRANRWGDDARAIAAAVRAEHPVLGLPLAGWEPRRPVPPDHWRLVYLWASWIPACRDELPALAALARGRDGLTSLAVARVDVLQTEDEIRKVFAGAGEGLWLDLEDGSAARAFRAEDLPRVYLVDPDGEVRYSGRGGELETLREALQRWVPR